MKNKLLSALTIRAAFVLAGGLTPLAFQSCKEPLEEVEAPARQEPQPSGTERPPELAFPGKQGVVKSGFLFGSPITYEEIEGQAVFEGDIILSPEQLSEATSSPNGRTSLAGVNDLAYRWLNNKVPFVIDSRTNRQLVLDAIAHWEQFTNLDFEEIAYSQVNTETSCIIFYPGQGCASAIGRRNSPQFITIPGNATKGNIIHAMGHAVGLFHEQSRADRDTYLKVHWNNIKSTKQGYYKKYADLAYNGLDHGNFDFSSIMLSPRYASSDIAINPNAPVMSKADGSHYVAQPYGLSAGDIKGINDMYPAGKFFNLQQKALGISAAPDGKVYIVSKDVAGSGGYVIKKQQGSGWVSVGNRGGIKVAAGKNGNVWMADASYNTYRLVNGQWQQVAGKARDIAINSSGTVFKISTESVAEGGHRVYKWNNGSWSAVGSGKGAIALAVPSSGFVHIVDPQHRIFYYSDQWRQTPGHAIDLAFGPLGESFYCLGTNNRLYKWGGKGWVRQPGLGDHLSVGPKDDVWIINYAQDVNLRRYLDIDFTQGPSL